MDGPLRIGVPLLETMTDHQTVPPAGGEPETSNPTTPLEGLSLKDTPSKWFEAERQSPQESIAFGSRLKLSPSVMPIRRKVPGSTLFLAGFVAVAVTGAFWATAELLGLFGSPWLAVPAGILIALIVRAACGRDDPESRSTVAAIAYLLTFLIVMALLTRREIHDIYGESNNVALLEQNLFRRRFSRLDQLAAYAIGWAASWFTSLWLRH